ncbi:MAG: hypothetical protein OEW47_07450 [Thermoleophilia bacterium]|nr:hypothetical protein [Thermoleophilia bacterium]
MLVLTPRSYPRGYNGEVASPSLRPLAIVASCALFIVALAGAAHGTSAVFPTASYASSIDAAPGTSLRTGSLARAATTFRGGLVTTSTGETVDVRVSDALPPETSTPEGWAEFLIGLTHGPEITSLTTYIAPLDEVQEICGSRALGCYSRNQMVALGDTAIPDVSPEEVVRHEYGHHIAMHRLNSPWVAVDWGPKNWASAADVCARTTRKEAFPGDEGSNYARNPGEAWAEVYRLMDERKAGITTATWPIIAPSFYPDDEALQAAERDVLQPWSAGKTTLSTRVFGKATKKVWWIPLSTALDGDLRVTATVPNGADPEVALVGSDRRKVVKRAQWVSQRVKRLTGSVCGQQGLFVRVTQKGALGRIRVSAATP